MAAIATSKDTIDSLFAHLTFLDVKIASTDTPSAKDIADRKKTAERLLEIDRILTSTPPDWDSLPEQIAKVWIPNKPKSIDDLKAKRIPVPAAGNHTIKIAKYPFARGGVRVAYYARIRQKDGSWKPYIAKMFIESKNQTKDNYLDQLENSGVANYLAEEWTKNTLEGRRSAVIGQGVKCLEARAMEVYDSTKSSSTSKWYNLENELDGEFTKWSNNIGSFLKPHNKNQQLYKFIKWTYEITEGYMIFGDVQGVRTEKGWELTDPAMLCKDLTRFKPTNFGECLYMCWEGVQHVLNTTKSISSATGRSSDGTSYVKGFTSKVDSSAYDIALSGYRSRKEAKRRKAAAARDKARKADFDEYSFLPTGGVTPGYRDHLPNFSSEFY